ncbi:MAG: signal recognition particle subunit SRP19/SEC65 family protein [Candidatus Thorarchaeota archaeon]
MRQRKGSIIIWPSYLDSRLSKAQGRRISVNLGAPNLTVDILREAAEMSGFTHEVEADKRYPREHVRRGGYLVVDNPEGHKKKRLLLMLAKSVRRVAAQRLSAKQAAEKKKGKKKKGRRK